MRLTQGSRIVLEYETELKDLASFVPKPTARGSLRVSAVDLEVDLIPLETRDFNAILGIDWLDRLHAFIDYFK